MTNSAHGSTASHIQTSFGEALAAAQTAFLALEQHKGASTVATTLETLNALLMMLDRGSNDAGLYRNVHPEAEVRAIADTYEQEFSKLGTELSLSRSIYDALTAIDLSNEDEVTKRYIKNALRDFRRAGVDKDPQSRERVRKLKEELVVTGQQFSKNINEDVRSIKMSAAELEGLPQDYIDAHSPATDGTVTITTDYPDYVPFMTYAKNDKRRRELYVINRQRGYPSNQKVLNELLSKRRELAGLLGYDSWARYITEDKMIKTPEAAQEFIDKVNKLAEPRSQEEYGTLLKRLQQDDPSLKAVGDWQKTYAEEVVRREYYSFDSQSVRAYFPYTRVKHGVLDTISAMFGVAFEADGKATVWHPSVEAYILKSGDELLGRFYLDMHPRENKYKHAAAFPIRSGVRGKQVPEAALVCNFPGGDSLMEHSDVETFFHEFGHLMHHLFGGNQRWVAVSGITTEWDFVEAPSQLLEEWAWNSDALKKFAISTKGETIPDALVEKMRATRDYGKGLATKHQMFYAALSLAFYSRETKGLDTTKVVEELQKKYSPFAYVPDTHFQFSFGHLDGYSAIYYTYMWSLAIAKDLFSVFERQGMFNPEPARRYRNVILESGGSRDADVIVHEFLNRDYSFDSFAEWLNR
ncbi:MAG: Zn-dependent oligopeptidase [Clostridia bacterium]|nr:Zn-dependent oligopeptidase [Deltaproteobacteria bacterium]